MVCLKRKLLELKRSRPRVIWSVGSALVLIGILATFCLGLLIYVWSNVWLKELPGGRHGPLDAYRHTLASAVLTYSLDNTVYDGFGLKAVEFVCWIMESGDLRSNQMDRHNNLLGSRLSKQAIAFSQIETKVETAVDQGMINSNDPNQVTWLPEADWRKGLLW